MSAALEQMLNDAARKTREEIQTQCEIEMRYPFTMNEQYLIQAHAREYKRIVDILFSPVPQAAKDEALAKLAAVGIVAGSFDDLSRKLQLPSEYTKEFEVISGALAYYQIASQRMIDFVPMRIEHHLVYGFAKAVEEKLIDMLGLLRDGGEERCAALVKMDSKIERERDSLSKQKEILVKASEILRAI